MTSPLRGPKREFYRQWQEAWQDKQALDIQGEYGYLFEYVHALIRVARTKADLVAIESELQALQQAYPFVALRENGSFHSYALEYLADIKIIQQRYQEAIHILAKAYKLFIPARVNTILSLKLFVGDDLSGLDIVFLRGIPPLTDWGRANWELVVSQADIFLGEKRRELGASILPTWVDVSKAALGDWKPLWTTCQLFCNVSDRFKTPIPYYYFDYVSPFSHSVADLVRQLENATRESQGLPRIGEGWITETELYYAIKASFPEMKVEQHASPAWLGRQHLDVYIPRKKVALEFQGDQHDRPIDYFGGEQAFEATQKRDALKQDLCTKNGVRLIYVRAGYSLKDILREIQRAD